MVAQIKNVPLASMSLPVAPPNSTIQVFTSPQRTFYADVFAQALRIAVQGTNTLVVQFLQGGINQGVNCARKLGQNLEWVRSALQRHIDIAEPKLVEAEQQAILELWAYTKAAIASGDYGLVVLDELNLTITMQVITEAEILEVIQNRPANVDVIFTGANMPASLMDCADQVTQRRI